MRFTIVLFFALFALNSLFAQTISGNIVGVKDGDKVWLYTNTEGSSENKWSLGQCIDSCVVKGGYFTMKTPESSYGRICMLRTKDMLLEFFFNKNEDFSVNGVVSPVGLLNSKTSGGKEYALMKDIFSILDNIYVTPINKRDGIEWLKRHATEDICPFATAYFYINKRKLSLSDVNEIMCCIPQSMRQNPYYKILRETFINDSMIQSGRVLPELNLYTASGQKIELNSFKNAPFIIFAGTARNYFQSYISKIKQLVELQQSMPNLCIILILPNFSKEISDIVASEIKSKNIILADYIKTSAANRALFNNKSKSQNVILVNKDRVILAVDPYLEGYESIFKRDLIVDGFTINGFVSGIDEGVAQLIISRKGTLGEPEIIDSVQIKEGYFTFRGKLEYPQYCNIVIKKALFPVGFFLENSSIDVNIFARNYIQNNNGATTVTKSLEGRAYGSRSEEEYKFLLNVKNIDVIEAWIKEHPTSIPVLLCLASTWNSKFAPEVIERLLSHVDKSLVNHVAYVETQNQINKRKIISVGNMAPDFSLPTADNKQVSLKDFKGKYVLIDFWASWCGPCRDEIPRLKKIWDRYSKNNFEIISITIDKKREDWIKALQAEKMPWTQLDANNSNVAALYNVKAIPNILLINPNGKIEAIDLRGEKLEKRLEEIFM